MYNLIQHFHSGWAYLAILVLIIAVINSFLGKSSKKEFTAKDRKVALFALIGAHIQLLIGFISSWISSFGTNERSFFAIDFIGTSINQYYCDCINYCGLVKT